jgi:mono/diheme cytochrome c family protein
MIDKEADLIVKRSRSFALLCAIILILITATFLVSFFSLPPDKPQLCGVIDNIQAHPPIDPGANSKGGKLFKVNCAVCHTPFSDQKLTGPGLAGIADRLPNPAEEWFTAWVLNNEKVLRSGDAYAKKIYAENGKAAMTVFEGQLSKEEVHEIYVYLTGK